MFSDTLLLLTRVKHPGMGRHPKMAPHTLRLHPAQASGHFEQRSGLTWDITPMRVTHVPPEIRGLMFEKFVSPPSSRRLMEPALSRG